MSRRKEDHIALALTNKDTLSPFATYTLTPRALPEIALENICPATTFLGKTLSFPLLISSMTAGIQQAGAINRRLAACAEQEQIAMGIGSLRKVLEERAMQGTNLRKVAPQALLLANLGAVQLNYGFSAADCQRAVDLIQADGLILHLNALQEAIQKGGNTNFAQLLPKIEHVVKKVSVPVIIKEVGQGLDRTSVKMLKEVGVKTFDIAGRGGTSFTAIEAKRRHNKKLEALFERWGLDTATSLLQLRTLRGIQIIASGGIRSGLDMAKAIALGASLNGMAKPFLIQSRRSASAVITFVRQLREEFRLAMFGCGCATIKALAKVKVWDEIRKEFI